METPHVQAEAEPQFKSYIRFFDHYLSHPRQPLSRLMHYAAIAIGVVTLLVAIWDGNPWLFVGGLIVGYALAWLAHTVVEKHDGAKLIYPLWALIADFHIVLLTMIGQIDVRRRVARHDHDYRA